MKLSLRAKTAILIVITALLFCAASSLLSLNRINKIIVEMYEQRAVEVAGTQAAVLDRDEIRELKGEVLGIFDAAQNKVYSDEWGSDDFNNYVALFSDIEKTESFKKVQSELRLIEDANRVDCIYLVWMAPGNPYYVYLCDGDYYDPCPPGVIDTLYEGDRHFAAGEDKSFGPIVTDSETYGWLVTAGMPVYDTDGEILAYAMVDISMNDIISQQNAYNKSFVAAILALAAAVCIICILLVNTAVIRPINRISDAASNYLVGGTDSTEQELAELKIKSSDEIGSLYASIMQMLTDIDGYVRNIVETSRERDEARIRADLMNELANKDALTGVGNKLSFDTKMEQLQKEIESGSPVFGIVMADLNNLKTINDIYGHDKGDLAIIKASRIMCDVFKDVPIYRYGGDEFVGVLSGRAYENAEQLIAEFNTALDAIAGEPWERLSAAVGFAGFDAAKDKRSFDVFRRADKDMYKCKQRMKRNNNI